MAKDPKKTIEELNEELSHFEDQIISVAELLSQRVKDAIEDIRDESAAVADIFEKKLKKSIRDIAKETDVTLKNTLKLLDGSAKLEDIEKARLQLDLKKAAALRNMNNAAKYMLEATNDKAKVDQFILDTETELNDIYEQQTVYLNDQEILAKKIQKNMGVTGAIMQGMTKIPILGNLINSQKVLAKIQQEAARDGSTKMSTFGAGVKAVGSSIASNLTDPAVGFGLVAKLLKFIIDAMFAADERVTKIGKGLSIGKEAAGGIYQNLQASKYTLDTIYNTTGYIAEAFTDLIEITDFATIATMDQVDAQLQLTKQLGLSKEEALGLQSTFAVNNTEAEKGIDIVYDQIAAFANQNKIVADGRKILAEIGKTSKLIQLNFRGNTAELTKGVLESKKLGLTLDQVSKIGNSLLNFEQSIASELEAELLTGRDINLEEARRYALNNDLVGLTKEINKQNITADSFAKMNRIQQEAIAGSLGMQAEELADALYKQQVIQKTAGNYTTQLREQAKLAKERGDYETQIKLEKEAAAVEQGILEGKNLKQAQEAASAQDKFNIAIEKVKEIFTDLAQDGGVIDKLVDYMGVLVDTLASGGSVFSLFGTSDLTKNYEKFQAKKAIENKENTNTNINAPRRAFATGGIVTKPITNATIGEAGPEAIVPLSEFMKEFKSLRTEISRLGERPIYVSVQLDGKELAKAMGQYTTEYGTSSSTTAYRTQ
jgi:hypothetical protein